MADEIKEVLGKLLLDFPAGRYDLVKLVKEWTYLIQHTDETKGMNASEVIKKAMDDVLSGRITEEDIKKAKAKIKTPPPEEPKSKE